MKTLHQRLQSRISQRRNFIRKEEIVLDALKQQRRNTAEFCDVFDVYFDRSGLNEEIDEVRKGLKALADDQRLDKKLKNLLAEQDSVRRFYDMPELA